MTTQTVLLDLDGTILDTIGLILASFHHAMKTERGQPLPDSHWVPLIGKPIEQQFESVSDDPAEIAQLAARYREFNRAHHDAKVRAYDGMRECIDGLKAAGKTLAIVTSKESQLATRGLQLCGFGSDFSLLIGADHVDNPKPAPEPVLLALHRLQARPETTVFIGDATHDMASGRAAGVRIGAALWGPNSRAELEPYTPDYWLETPADIVKALL